MGSFDVASRWPIADVSFCPTPASLADTCVSLSARDGPLTVVCLMSSVDVRTTPMIATINAVRHEAAISAITDGDETQ